MENVVEGNHEWVQKVKERLWETAGRSGKSLSRISDEINEKGAFCVNYSTLRATMDPGCDTLNAAVVAALCDLFGEDCGYVFGGEERDEFYEIEISGDDGKTASFTVHRKAAKKAPD